MKQQDLFEVLKTSAIVLRVLSGVFGFVFLGTGISVLVSLWNGSFGGFGEPPLLFRLIGSLISLAFIAFGGVTCLGALSARYMLNKVASVKLEPPAFDASDFPAAAPQPPAVGYVCPQCGAPLASDAEVSPLGDVKCTFCQRWFNIHQR
jgi:DNA-directed RNA polymerase subunit RPC12/RpoP